MNTLLSNLTSLGTRAPLLAVMSLPLRLGAAGGSAVPLAAEPFDFLPGDLRSEAFAEDLLGDEAYAASGL